jgi:threonine/homoserine/homoserine lactone efflux protein
MLWKRKVAHQTTQGTGAAETPCGPGAALLTALANPATAAYFASSSFFVTAPTFSMRLMAMATIVSAGAATWFTFVTWILSRECFRFRTARFMREIETGAALMLIAFGLMTMLRAT